MEIAICKIQKTDLQPLPWFSFKLMEYIKRKRSKVLGAEYIHTEYIQNALKN